MKIIVFNGHNDRVGIIVKEDGDLIDFNSGASRMTLELIGRGVVADTDEDPALITWGPLGEVYFTLGSLGVSPGTYKAILKVYDVTHPEGQVLLHPAKGDAALLEVQVVDDNATVIPIDRKAEWPDKHVPELTIGDPFIHPITLLQGTTPAPFNFNAATSVRVAVIKADHSARITSPVTQDSATPGANWVEGNLGIVLPATVTAELADWFSKRTLVKLEIEVIIDDNRFTWSAHVYVVPGWIE